VVGGIYYRAQVSHMKLCASRAFWLVAYQFICHNGLAVGDASHDIRVPHKDRIEHEVIEGAFRVLDDFEAVDQAAEGMKGLDLKPEEERAFATTALALRYGERTEGQPPAPITVEQLTEARRPQDQGRSLWMSFQRVRENATLMRMQAGPTMNQRRRPSASMGRPP
jgi:hypothetical protein